MDNIASLNEYKNVLDISSSLRCNINNRSSNQLLKLAIMISSAILSEYSTRSTFDQLPVIKIRLVSQLTDRSFCTVLAKSLKYCM